MVEAIQLIKCDLVNNDDKMTFNLSSIKNRLGLLNFYLSALAGFLGGVQGSFIWGFTMASKQDNGMYHISTYLYMAIGFFFGGM